MGFINYFPLCLYYVRNRHTVIWTCFYIHTLFELIEIKIRDESTIYKAASKSVENYSQKYERNSIYLL